MQDTDNQGPAYEPDFELSHRNAVREDNWAEYEAKGFGVLSVPTDDEDSVGHLRLAQHEFGIGNVFTGEAFDHEAGRPLRHKPGMSIYVSPEGVRYRELRRDDKDHESSDEPAAS